MHWQVSIMVGSMMTILRYLIAIYIIGGYSAHATTLLLVTLESPPAEYSVNGNSTGRNVEVAQECFKRMGYHSVVKIIPWKRALIMVEKGTADAIIDAAYTKERAAYLFYPDEEIYIEQWFAFKRQDDPHTLDQGLANANQYTVGLSRGFEYGGLIQEAINSSRFKHIDRVVDNRMNIRKLIGDRFDMFIGVKLTILNLSKQMGVQDQISVVNQTETGAPYLLSSSKTYVAFSKMTMTREITSLFSSTLKSMKQGGTVRRIEKKYM